MSAVLKRFVDQAVFLPAERAANPIAFESSRRSKRLYVRLAEADRQLLTARAEARSMPEATYASLCLRTHVRGSSPVPKIELAALLKSIAELTALRRTLRDLVESSSTGSAAREFSPGNAHLILQACDALRRHTKSLIEANAASWGGRAGE